MKWLCRLIDHRWSIKGVTGEHEWCSRCGAKRTANALTAFDVDRIADRISPNEVRQEAGQFVDCFPDGDRNNPPLWVRLWACRQAAKRHGHAELLLP